jgi:hypothetical protein
VRATLSIKNLFETMRRIMHGWSEWRMIGAKPAGRGQAAAHNNISMSIGIINNNFESLSSTPTSPRRRSSTSHRFSIVTARRREQHLPLFNLEKYNCEHCQNTLPSILRLNANQRTHHTYHLSPLALRSVVAQFIILARPFTTKPEMPSYL